MRRFREAIPGIFCIVAISAVIGFAWNAIRSDGLSIVRKPLRETRAFVPGEQIATRIVKEKQDLPPRRNPAKPVLIPLRMTQARRVPISTGRETRPRLVTVPPKRGAPTLKPTTQKIQALFTTLGDAKAAFDSGRALFLDARPTEDYQEEHIKRAVSIDVTRIDKLLPAALKSATKDTLLVTYCGGPECGDATKLADALLARGFTKVVILIEGLSEWKKAGYPVSLKGDSE